MEHLRQFKRKPFRHTLSAPIIYAMIVPFVILDIFAEIYHRICFPLYGLPLIKRSSYFKFDRYKLPYLTTLQKFNCLYCSYGNGLMHYVGTIAAETERYWCGIQHDSCTQFIPPKHHKDFLKYGDKEGLKEIKKLSELDQFT